MTSLVAAPITTAIARASMFCLMRNALNSLSMAHSAGVAPAAGEPWPSGRYVAIDSSTVEKPPLACGAISHRPTFACWRLDGHVRQEAPNVSHPAGAMTRPPGMSLARTLSLLTGAVIALCLLVVLAVAYATLTRSAITSAAEG